MTEPTPKLTPGHHHGVTFDYFVRDDGSVELHEDIIERMQAMIDRDAALQEVIKSAVAAAQERWSALNAERRTFWNDINEELGLAKADMWQYADGVIAKMAPPPRSSEAAAAAAAARLPAQRASSEGDKP